MTIMKFFIEIMSTLKVIKSFLKGHMINRILHLQSFHMKFVKLAKGSFDEISYELTTCVRSTIYNIFYIQASLSEAMVMGKI